MKPQLKPRKLKDLRAKELSRGKTPSRRDINYSNRSFDYKLPNSRDGKRVGVIQGRTIVCQICNKTGHSALTYYQRDPNREINTRERFSNNPTNNYNNNRYKNNNYSKILN